MPHTYIGMWHNGITALFNYRQNSPKLGLNNPNPHLRQPENPNLKLVKHLIKSVFPHSGISPLYGISPFGNISPIRYFHIREYLPL